MIEALKDDKLINKIGGRFKLTALVQRRWVQLMKGARPMVETKGLSDLEVVLKEIVEGKIEPIFADETSKEEDDKD